MVVDNEWWIWPWGNNSGKIIIMYIWMTKQRAQLFDYNQFAENIVDI